MLNESDNMLIIDLSHRSENTKLIFGAKEKTNFGSAFGLSRSTITGFVFIAVVAEKLWAFVSHLVNSYGCLEFLIKGVSVKCRLLVAAKNRSQRE